MKSAVVLTLHGVAPDTGQIAGQDAAAAKYTVQSSLLEQLAAAVAEGEHDTLAGYCGAASGDFSVLTFDDGLISDFSEAFPVLLQKGVRATFFVSAANVGKKGYLARAHLQEMARHGMEIASHGVEHRYLVTLPETEARKEIAQSKETLEQLLGQRVDCFAPVGGHHLPWMVTCAREAGYLAFATMVPGRTGGGAQAPLLVRRNHLQSHHTPEYAARLARGERALLTRNYCRYLMLSCSKRILGMDNYDRIKEMLMGRDLPR